MDFHQLKSFYYVANYLNFSKAAEKVSLSQPAVSRQIEALEAYYKLSLFNRSGRKVELTDAGRRLLQYAEKILMLMDETEKAMNALNNLETGELRVGACSTVGNYILPGLIVDFQNKYGNIKVDLFIDKTDIIIEKLKRGELDVAITGKSDHDPDFNYKAILKDELLLIANQVFPVDPSTSSLQQFQNETFFLKKNGSNMRKYIDYLFDSLQFKPNKIIEFDSCEAIKQAVATGKGVGFISGQIVKNELELGLLKSIQLPESSHRTFSLIFPKEKFISPSLLIFNNYIKKNIYSIG